MSTRKQRLSISQVFRVDHATHVLRPKTRGLFIDLDFSKEPILLNRKSVIVALEKRGGSTFSYMSR